jgi:phosphoserine phosphatase
MSDPDIHLKLDRILAGQTQLLARMDESDETVRVLSAAISLQLEAVNTQTEVINRLSDAMSREEGGDLAQEIAAIAVALKQIQQDGARLVVLVGRMPTAVAKAAQDAVLMAMGEGVNIAPKDP